MAKPDDRMGITLSWWGPVTRLGIRVTDLHILTAEAILKLPWSALTYGDREEMKTLNFAQSYGSSSARRGLRIHHYLQRNYL